MESVLRALVVYAALLLIFRVTGNRALAKMNSFDLVLLLIIGEAASQGLIGEDFSIINALLVIATLVCVELGLTMVKHRFPTAEKLIDDVPAVILRDGKPDQACMDRLRLDVGDILEAARKTRGLCELADIRLAVLERDGQISIIPADRAD
jgi:uncharacterized membrane protein YcaP (DUF421 family)